MFCNNCGTQFPDGTAFCPKCGAPAGAPTVAPAADSAAPAAASQGGDKKKPIIAIVAVVAIVAVLWGLYSLIFPSPKSVAKNYAKAWTTGDISAQLKYTLQDKKEFEKGFKDYLDERGLDKSDVFEAAEKVFDTKNIKDFNGLYKAYKKYTKEEQEDEYGKFSLSVKAFEAVKYTKDELKDLKKRYEDSEDIDDDKIQAAYHVLVSARIKGKDDSSYDAGEVTVVKYKGKGLKILDASVSYYQILEPLQNKLDK